MAKNHQLKTIKYQELLGEKKGVEIRYLFHLSDIHLRNYARHREYREVFAKLYQQISEWLVEKDSSSALIVITGDLVHSKSHMSSELIIEVRDFLDSLSQILPVILIAGNHDLNLSNRDLVDSLSGILHRVESNNLYYLRESGVYRWANLLFSVMSVLDYPLITAKQVDQVISHRQELKDQLMIKVGLLHATIDGSQVWSSDRLQNSDKYRTKDFQGYDAVLLGDIHLHQFLGPSEVAGGIVDQVGGKFKRIAYAGSLIQQSFGEQLGDHGYLFWDLKQMENTRLVPVWNQYGYLNLWMEQDELYPTDLIKKLREGNWGQVPRRIRVKIKFLDRESRVSTAEKFIDVLRMKDFIIEEKIINLFSGRMEGISSDPDFTNLDRNIEKLMTKYYQVRELGSQSKLEQLIKYHQEVVKDALAGINGSADQFVSESDWSLRYLEFENVLNFQGKNRIEFGNYQGVVGIIGPNFSGKSNLLDILLFALFDKASRGDRTDILTMGQRAMSIKCGFQIGDRQYLIHRYGKVGSGKDHKVKIDVKFSCEDQDLTGENRAQTNSRIFSLIGRYEDFILTNLKLQDGSKGSLIELSNAQRKERLVELLQLDQLETFYKFASGKLRDNKKLGQVYRGDLDGVDPKIGFRLNQVLDQLLRDRTELNFLLAELELEEQKLLNQSREVEKVDLAKLNEMEEQLGDGPVEKVDLSMIRAYDRDLENFGRMIRQLEQKRGNLNFQMNHEELEENIELYQETIAKEEHNLEEFLEQEEQDAERLEELIELVNGLRLKFNQYQIKMRESEVLRGKIERAEEDQRKLLGLKYDPKCKFCCQNIFVQDAIACRQKLKGWKQELELKTQEVLELSRVDEDYVQGREEIDRLNQKLREKQSTGIKKQIEEWQNELKMLEEDRAHLDLNLGIEVKIAKLEQNREKLGKMREQIWSNWERSQLASKISELQEVEKKNQGRMEEIKVLEQTVAKLKKRKMELETSVMKLDGQSQILGHQMDELEKKRVKLQEIESDNQILEVYAQMMSKDGISKYLIEQYVPEFELRVNWMMEKMVDFKIKMEIEEKKWNIYIQYPGKKLNIDLCSGYERFVVGLAIKSSLADLSQLSKPGFMVIDEGFGALDQARLREIGRILDYLRGKYQFVLLITHVEQIKDELDTRIRIERCAGGISKIVG